MKDALEKRLKVKGGAGMLIRGLVVVVHVLHSLVPQEEQEAALEVSVI